MVTEDPSDMDKFALLRAQIPNIASPLMFELIINMAFFNKIIVIIFTYLFIVF